MSEPPEHAIDPKAKKARENYMRAQAELQKIYEGEIEREVEAPKEEVEDKEKELRQARGAAIQAREEVKAWENHEDQEKAYESFEASYGKKTIGVSRPTGTQLKPEKPPLSPRGFFLSEVKEPSPYEDTGTLSPEGAFIRKKKRRL